MPGENVRGLLRRKRVRGNYRTFLHHMIRRTTFVAHDRKCVEDIGDKLQYRRRLNEKRLNRIIMRGENTVWFKFLIRL